MPSDGPRALLFLVILLFFFLSPDTRQPSLSRQRDFADQVANERSALQVLNSSDHNALEGASERWLNLTGLRGGDGFLWDLLPVVKERARAQAKSIKLNTAQLATQNGTSALQIRQMHEPGLGGVTPDPEKFINAFEDKIPMYSNVTSILRGKWVRSKTEKHSERKPINLTTLAPGASYTSRKFQRNITGWDGDVQIKLAESSNNVETGVDSRIIRDIKAEITLQDETSTGDGWDATMYGVHLVRQGSIVLTTTSEKFQGIFALPHFTLSTEAYDLAQKLLSLGLQREIDKQEHSFDAAFNPWTSAPNRPSENMFPVPHCELIVYLQQHPSSDPGLSFQDIERELRYPTGLSLSSIPPVKMTALIFSPDCGFILESKGPPDYPPTEGLHLVGKKKEAYIKAARHFVLGFALLVCAEIYLLKGQINEASTPSTKSRISFYSIAMMALGDGFACMSFLVAGMFIEALFIPLVATAFLSFLCVSFFGMKFLMDIWTVQAPERRDREREQQRRRAERNAAAAASQQAPSNNPAANTTPLQPSTNEPTDTLPLPATAQRTARPPTPIIITPDQDLDAAAADDNNTNPTATNPQQTALGSARREIGALYSKFYFLLLSLLFLSLHATTWPLPLRTLYTNTLSTIYLSLWLPQIHRNIQRNCRKALTWTFVLGQSLVRLAPFAYFYCWTDNVLFVTTSPGSMLALGAWVWIQVFVLLSQEAVGARFFVPEGWAPLAYDYHPVLREADAEGGGGNMPVGFTEAIALPTSPSSAALAGRPSTTTSRAKNAEARGGKDGKKPHTRTFDCAICTESFDVPVVPPLSTPSDTSNTERGGDEGALMASTTAAAATIFARRAYMVTPCRHIFHSGCLEGWMRYRLQCPICREGLPPL